VIKSARSDLREGLRLIHDDWRQFVDQDDEIDAWRDERMRGRSS